MTSFIEQLARAGCMANGVNPDARASSGRDDERFVWQSWARHYVAPLLPIISAQSSIELALAEIPAGWTYVQLEICRRGLPEEQARVMIERTDGPDGFERSWEFHQTLSGALALALSGLSHPVKSKPL